MTERRFTERGITSREMTGKVRVLVPLEPWRLALNLTPVELSREHLVAILPKASSDSRSLFHEGDPYELQLEPEGEALPIAGIKSKLRRLTDSPFGLELDFAFDTSLESLP